jgi:hypothetical protein
MKIGTGAEATLRFWLRNLKNCNAGITDGGVIKCAVEMDSGGMVYLLYKNNSNIFQN